MVSCRISDLKNGNGKPADVKSANPLGHKQMHLCTKTLTKWMDENYWSWPI